jgi:hypothetical protein
MRQGIYSPGGLTDWDLLSFMAMNFFHPDYLVVPSIGLKLLVDVSLLTNVEAIVIEAVIVVTGMSLFRDKRTK